MSHLKRSKTASMSGSSELHSHGRRTRRCSSPPFLVLVSAVLALTWLWPEGSSLQRSSPVKLLAPQTSKAAGANHFELAAGDEPLPVRHGALARMAARVRTQQAIAGAAGDTATLHPEGTAASTLTMLQQAAGKPQQQTVAAAQQKAGAGGAGVDQALSAAAAAAAPITMTPASQGPEDGECRPSLVVMLTSHKTGTAQAGCITEMTEQRYIMQGASRHDHHPPSLHAVSEFAGQRLQTQFSGGGGAALGRLYCPSVKFYSSGHHLPRMEDESCPGTLPCPCQGEQEQCLATEGGTIDIPLGNTTVVQVVRSPVNVVLSAYQYHTQEPAPEEWLEFMTMSNFSGWMFAGGVPYEALDSLGAHSRPEESFYSFLRRLPEDQGVKLQFWMSAWELYGFARQYLSLQQQQQRPGLHFLPVRFEDLQSQYNATTRALLEAFKERVPALDIEGLLEEVQVCHISTWSDLHVASHEHVTSSKNPALRARLRAILMTDAEIAPRLCNLNRLFGYPDEAECLPGGAGAGRGTDPGWATLIGDRRVGGAAGDGDV